MYWIKKSGSSWFFNLTNDILIESGFSDAREVRDTFNLYDFIEYQSCEVQDLSESNIKKLTLGPVSDHTFAVKTHSKPNDLVIKKIKKGKIKQLIIARDPRDMVLSVLGAGKILRARGYLKGSGEYILLMKH